jgi:hypothetical protein
MLDAYSYAETAGAALAEEYLEETHERLRITWAEVLERLAKREREKRHESSLLYRNGSIVSVARSDIRHRKAK